MSRHRSPLEIAAGLNLAALHTGITLWHRWPFLMGLGGKGRTVELNRMLNEKVDAVAKGMMASHAEAIRISVAAMSGKCGDPLTASLAIVDAAMRPALRTVRSNSRRLSRHT